MTSIPEDIQTTVARFEVTIKKALVAQYGSALEIHPRHIERVHIAQVLEAYQRSDLYRAERMEKVATLLMDLKLEFYFLTEVDNRLSLVIEAQGPYDSKNPLATPHTYLALLAIEQSVIGKARILWDRIMNLVYYLETGNEIPRKKSKKTQFFKFIDDKPRWKYLVPFLATLTTHDDSFRTPEFHKASMLRAVLMGDREMPSRGSVGRISFYAEWFFDNLVPMLGDGEPNDFTDQHVAQLQRRGLEVD